MNFSQITPRIWAGSAISLVQDVSLLTDGFNPTRIINCRAEFDDKPLLDQAGYGGLYLWDGIPDWTPEVMLGLEPIPDSFFKAGLDFWVPYNYLLSETVYVHCKAGINRSIVLVYAMLLALGKCRSDAIVLINKNRPVTVFSDFLDHPWRENAEHAVMRLGYVVR